MTTVELPTVDRRAAIWHARRMRLAVIMVAALAEGVAARAAAQPTAWVVAVASTGGDFSASDRAATQAEARLREEGHTVLTGPTLRARLAERLSVPFEPLRADELQRLANTVETAVELVAFGSNDPARTTIEPVLRDADRRLAAIGRNDAAARHLQNLCGYLVRALAASRRSDDARAQALHCARAAQDLPLDPQQHPPDVRRIYEDARQAIERGASVLVVEAPDAEEGCVLRVQGRRSTTSLPARIPVTPGAYDVQIECRGETPGRVHRIVVNAGEVRMSIDPTLDAVLGTSSDLRLTYASPEEQARLLARHVGELGAALGVGNVLVVRASSMSFERFSVTSAGVAERVAAAAAEHEGGAMPGEGGAAPEQRDRDDGGSRPLIGPLALGVAGLALAGIATLGIAASGGCVREDDLGCAVRRNPDWLVIGALGAAGLISIGGAVTWFLLGGADGDERRAGLVVHASF